MSCYSPLRAFYRLGSDGKKIITFYNESYSKPYESYPEDIKVSLPCGQCIGCRLDYAKQWSIRCMLEASQWEHNYFVTLTYNDDNLPIKDNYIPDVDTGEVLNEFKSAPLVPDDLTRFMKKVRNYFSYHYNYDNIRFFACGEYGDKNLRPHFHVILFNCPLPDLDFLKNSFNGDIYWRSSILEDCWDNKGFVCVANCTYETCNYVARYMLKKQKGKNANYYSDLGLVPPFTRSSRRPGIAREYYDKNRDKIYKYDNLVITGKGGLAQHVKPPKYYDRLYDIFDPDDLKRIKSKREESAKFSLNNKLAQTDLSEDELLRVAEDVFISKSKKLVRPI